MAKADKNTGIDPIYILVTGVRQAKFTNKELGDSLRELAETLMKDLDEVRYEPNEVVINQAKEVAALLISDISGGTDRILSTSVTTSSNDDDEEESGRDLRKGDDEEED